MSSMTGPIVEGLLRETDNWVWKNETLRKFLVLQESHSRFVDCVDLVAHNLALSHVAAASVPADMKQLSWPTRPTLKGWQKVPVCKPKAGMLSRLEFCVEPWPIQP